MLRKAFSFELCSYFSTCSNNVITKKFKSFYYFLFVATTFNETMRVAEKLSSLVHWRFSAYYEDLNLTRDITLHSHVLRRS